MENLGLAASDDSGVGSQARLVGNLIQKLVFESIYWSIDVLLGDAWTSMFRLDHLRDLPHEIICLRLEFLLVGRADIQPELSSLSMLARRRMRELTPLSLFCLKAILILNSKLEVVAMISISTDPTLGCRR